MINSDWYRYFLSAAESGSFTKGAKTLGITQSALSQGVKNLEEHLGTNLFQRRPRGIHLTREGQTLLGYVRESYRLLGLGEQEIMEQNQLGRGDIILGAGDTVCKHFLLPGIGEFHTSFPGIRISIMNRTSAELITLLEERIVDVAVVTARPERPPAAKTGISAIQLFSIEDCFACSPVQNPPSHYRDSTGFLKKSLLLLPSRRTATRRNLSSFLEKEGISIEESIDFESVELQIEFAKMGMGTACAPRKSMQNEIDEGTLKEIPLKTPIPPRIVWGMFHSPPSIRVEKFIEAVGKGETSLPLKKE